VWYFIALTLSTNLHLQTVFDDLKKTLVEGSKAPIDEKLPGEGMPGHLHRAWKKKQRDSQQVESGIAVAANLNSFEKPI
jgi:hypothetical protein